MSRRILLALCLAVPAAAALTAGCTMTSPGPLALSSTGAPPAGVQRTDVNAVAEPKPEPEVLTAQSDRVPKPDEIFQFHTKGPHGDTWRQPFLIDPNDGPLKIRRWTAEEMAAADAQRLDLGLHLHGHPLKQDKATGKAPADRRKTLPGAAAPTPDP